MFDIKKCLKRQKELRDRLFLEKNEKEDEKMCRDLFHMMQSIRTLKYRSKENLKN